MHDDDATPPGGRPAIPPSAWRRFAAWPGATSLITLLSAALLLLGLRGVLAPSLGDEARLAPRWQVLGALAAYLGALLAGVWAMCRARAGNPDAVASAVVGAALAVGYGVVVHLLAAAQPRSAACAALAGWIGILCLGRGFDRAAGASGWAGAGPALAALYAWSTLWPLALAAIAAREALRMPTAGAGAPGTDAAMMAWWTAGSGMLLAIILALLPRVRPPAAAGAFLAGAAMRWILVLVAAAAAIAALAVQAHVAGLDLAWGDCLPHLAALLLLANELAAAVWGRRLLRDAAAVALPALLAAGLALAGAGPPSSAFRGAGWAPEAVGALGAGPLLPLLLAAGGALLGWRRAAPGLAWGALTAAVAAVAAWDPARPLLAEAGLALALAIALAAGRGGCPRLAVAGVASAAFLAPPTRLAVSMLGDAIAAPLPMLTAAWAALLVCAAWRPAWVAPGWARAAAWLLGAVAAGTALLLLAGRRVGPLPGGTAAVGVAAALALILACAWRRRDLGIAAAAAPAGVALAWPIAALLGRAWLAVLGAFALLGGGVLLAVRRARISRP